MALPGDSVKSALFRAAPGGWVFRLPNPWVFGDTPHYLVNDAQKSQIEAILALRRPRVVAAVLLGGILVWTVLVATFMWAFAGHQDPTPGDIGVMVVLIVLPLIALLPIAGLVQRRRLSRCSPRHLLRPRGSHSLSCRKRFEQPPPSSSPSTL